MSFFGVPLSGLNASQAELQSVSNNLANLDTVAYKDQNVSFADLFAQSSSINGANDPVQTGEGVTVSQTTSDFADGGASATNISSNMALSGNGFFIAQQADGSTAYTRAGDITTNQLGQLTTASGALILGYPAVNGIVSTTSALGPLQTGLGMTSPANATTNVQVITNLQAGSTAPYAGTPTAVYDSIGNSHLLTMTYTPTGTTGQWSYSASMPSSDFTAGATGNTVVGSGTMTFNSSGVLSSFSQAAPTAPPGPAATATSIGISATGFTDGAAAMNLSWNLADSAGKTITQTNLANATSSTTQDGRAAGTLSEYAIAKDGTVEGTFSNGATQALGQVALATFVNNQGLQQTGSNLFDATNGSGAANIGIAGTGGRGTITGGSIESSNVDVAAEFAKMIVAQQAYSADAKAITTFQQVSEATIAMISG